MFADNLPEKIIGRSDYENRIIFIKRNMNYQEQYRTTIHEIVHAYLWSFGYGTDRQWCEEELCEFIACNIFNIQKCLDVAVKELQKRK